MDKKLQEALLKVAGVVRRLAGSEREFATHLGGEAFLVRLGEEYRGFDTCPVCQRAVPQREWIVQSGGLEVTIWEIDLHLATNSRSDLANIDLHMTEEDQKTLVHIFGELD